VALMRTTASVNGAPSSSYTTPEIMSFLEVQDVSVIR
jgi:hypothetical protein